jgi:hypothetical protein
MVLPRSIIGDPIWENAGRVGPAVERKAIPSARVLAAAMLVACSLTGCAASIEPQGYAIAGDAPKAAAGASTSTSAAPASGYQLSEEEKSADCGRLTGRMKIRILALKDSMKRTNTSELSRSLHSATAAMGGSASGSYPYGDEQRDRALLEAYNQQLAAKGCKTLDLANELRPDAQWSTEAKPAGGTQP